MVITTEQHKLLIHAIAIEIESNREVSEHDYTTQQNSRNVIGFLSGLLLAASFGNRHETEPVTFPTSSHDTPSQ